MYIHLSQKFININHHLQLCQVTPLPLLSSLLSTPCLIQTCPSDRPDRETITALVSLCSCFPVFLLSAAAHWHKHFLDQHCLTVSWFCIVKSSILKILFVKKLIFLISYVTWLAVLIRASLTRASAAVLNVGGSGWIFVDSPSWGVSLYAHLYPSNMVSLNVQLSAWWAGERFCV